MDPHLFERVDKWNYEPGPLLNIRNTFILYLLAVLFSPFIYYENTKLSLLLYLHLYLPLYTFYHHHHHLHFIFAIATTIIFVFICFVFSYLFCFLESLTKLARTCDTLDGKQGSMFFLLHVGSILTRICATLILCSCRPSHVCNAASIFLPF